MSFLGPDVELKPGWKPGPRWKQRWWWRERIPGIVAAVVLATLMGLAAWLPFYFNDRSDDSAAHPRDAASGEPHSLAPSGTPRPTEQPPQLPEAAHQFSDKGIEATIRFEIDAINYAQRTGNLEPAKSVYNLNLCKFCNLLVERLSSSIKNGTKLVDADYSVNSIETKTGPGDNGKVIALSEVSKKQLRNPILVDSNGNKKSEASAMAENKFLYELMFVSNRWIIQEIR